MGDGSGRRCGGGWWERGEGNARGWKEKGDMKSVGDDRK